VLLSVGGISVLLIATALFADSPDTAKPRLKEGVFVRRDTTRRPPNPVSRQALERLQANSVKKWKVHWHPETGLPGLGGGQTEKRYSGNAEEIAITFFEDYKDLLLGVADFQQLARHAVQIRNVIPEQGYTVVLMDQFFKGVKVYQGGMSFWISESKPYYNKVINALQPLALDHLRPSFSLSEVEETIRRAAYPDSISAADEDLQLCIYPSSPPRLAYAGFKRIGIWTWSIIIDANNGKFIRLHRLGHEDGRPPSINEQPVSPVPDSGPRPTGASNR
jgi:hypothetical protein